MESLLYLCTKNVHFSFNNEIYQQTDGVAMGSPLGPIIAGIFMVELENTLVPSLSEHLLFWKRYVDDTLCYVKKGSLQHVLSALNNFHDNIKFTYETECNNMISFLDVLIVRNNNKFDTAVFRKSTHTDLYINWNSFSPETWKKSTLKLLVKRAYIICNKPYFLEMELEHLKETFVKINNFPLIVVNRIFKQVADENAIVLEAQQNTVEPNETVTVRITLPYAGKKGEDIAKEINSHMKQVKPKLKARVAFKAKRVGSYFNIKDKVKKEHEHNLVYETRCPDCDVIYVGEAGRRLSMRVDDHGGKDKKSHVLKHSVETGHKRITLNDTRILNKNFSNYYKRKISEALFIKQKNPVLNIQDKSVPLKLFN